MAETTAGGKAETAKTARSKMMTTSNERAQDIENLIRQRIKHYSEWRVRRSDDVIAVYPKDVPFDDLTAKIMGLFEDERLEREHPNE